MTVEIEPMEERDVEAVRDLGLRSSEVWVGPEEFYGVERLRSWTRDEGSVAFVARDGGRVVGFTLASVLPHAGEAYSHATAVEPGHEHLGIGSRLLDASAAALAERGCERVWGITAIDNEAMQRMQERLGWRRRGSFFYYDRRLRS